MHLEPCEAYRRQFALPETHAALYSLLAEQSFLAPATAQGLRDYSVTFFGTPALYSIKCGDRPSGALRVAFEPGGREITIAQQVDCCLSLLNEAASQLDWSPCVADAVNRAAQALFPADAAQTRGWEGGLWLGMDSSDDPPMVKLYASLRHFPVQEGWQRLADLFGEFADQQMEPVLRRAIEHAAAYGAPVGVCCGFHAGGLAGVRFYSDLKAPSLAQIDALSEAFFPGAHDDVSAFCARFVATFGEFAPHSVTVGYDFASDGNTLFPELARIKFELSSCLFSAEEQRALPSWVAQEALLPCDNLPGEISRATECFGALYFHYLSVGMQRGGKRHLTLYFEPFALPWLQIYKLGCAARRIREFLLQSQEADGAWRAFDLFPGASDAWVTAYVGLCLLEDVRPPCDDLERALRRAGAFLRQQLRHGHGWGYHAALRCDCDSTAHALLFLTRLQAQFPDDAFTFPHAELDSMLRFQGEAGGFATYDEGKHDGWNAEQPDVTALALHALALCSPQDTAGGRLPHVQAAMDGAQTYLSQRTGLTPSYWWESPFYTALKTRDAYAAAGIAFTDPALCPALEAAALPETPFDCALYLELLCKTANCAALPVQSSPADFPHKAILAAAEQLRALEQQGRFAAHPILRVTSRACLHASGAEGAVFPDENGVFTAATALRAFCVCRAYLERKEYALDAQ